MTERDSASPAAHRSAPAPAFCDEVDTPALILDKAIVDAGLKAITPELGDPGDRQRVAGVAELPDAGYRDGVLPSQDVVTRAQLAEYGGSGDARVARGLAGRARLRPALRERRA